MSGRASAGWQLHFAALQPVWLQFGSTWCSWPGLIASAADYRGARRGLRDGSRPRLQVVKIKAARSNFPKTGAARQRSPDGLGWPVDASCLVPLQISQVLWCTMNVKGRIAQLFLPLSGRGKRSTDLTRDPTISRIKARPGKNQCNQLRHPSPSVPGPTSSISPGVCQSPYRDHSARASIADSRSSASA